MRPSSFSSHNLYYHPFLQSPSSLSFLLFLIKVVLLHPLFLSLLLLLLRPSSP